MLSARTLLTLGLGLLATSCATEDRFSVRVMQPAPVDLWQYDLIALDRFSGDGADELSYEMSAALKNTVNPLTGQSDFEIVDRAEVDQVLDDLRSRRGKEWDDRAKHALDRWRQAEIVIKGDVDAYEVTDQIAEHEIADKQGGRRVRRTRTCTAHLGVVIQSTGVEGERVFDQVRYDETANATTVAYDGEPDQIDYDGLLAQVRQQVVANFMERVTPHEKWVSVRLFKDGDLPELAIGNGYAKTGDWSEAYESYQAARERATGELQELRHKAVYNMGIALMYSNQFEAATDALKEAFALSQDQRILNDIQSVRDRESDYQRLMEQSQAANPGR